MCLFMIYNNGSNIDSGIGISVASKNASKMTSGIAYGVMV